MDTRYIDIKFFVIQIVILAILFGYPPASAAQADTGDGYTNDLCLECHAEMAEDHAESVHSETECLACHPGAAVEDHEEVPVVDCRQCHAPHDEKMAHDAHTRISCKACHQKDGIAVLEQGSKAVIFSGETVPGRELWPHQMVVRKGDAACRSCHFSGNTLGATAMLLPPKSLLCMPCHVATVSITDRTTLFSILIFLLGIGGLGATWFSAGRVRQSGHTRPSDRSPLGVAIVADGLLIKKLYRLSPARWCIHALIYFPILVRLVFGLVALGMSLTFPEAELTRTLLDKNHPLRGLFFDLTGLMIITGVGAALLRVNENRETIPNLPASGGGMTILLGLIVLVGFILEGLRIAMTGWPAGSHYAFLGYGLSLMLKGMTGLTDIYGYVWYGHAILTGIFVALIPFTRMIHIFTAPVVLMADARIRFQPKT